MNIKRRCILWFALMVAMGVCSVRMDAAAKDKVVLKDGMAVIGEIQKETFKAVILNKPDGTQDAKKWSDVVRIEYDGESALSIQGRQAVSLGKWEESKADFEGLLQAIRKGEVRSLFEQEALFYLFQTYVSLGENEKALERARSLISTYGQSRFLMDIFPFLLQLARQKEERAQVQTLLDKIEEGVSSIQDERLTLRFDATKAQFLEFQGGSDALDQARDLYYQVEQSKDDQVQGLAKLGLARILLKRNLVDDAVSKFKELTRIASYSSYLHASAWNGLGASWIQKAGQSPSLDLYKKSFLAYLHTYLLYPPKPGDPDDAFVEAIYFSGFCSEKMASLASTEAVKNTYLKRRDLFYNEVKRFYPHSVWVKRIGDG